MTLKAFQFHVGLLIPFIDEKCGMGFSLIRSMTGEVQRCKVITPQVSSVKNANIAAELAGPGLDFP